MGVKNSMNTFFAAMQGQNSSGYGGRIVNTPMGPFRWDDNFNMWVNVNNGMALSNISFQDEFAMMNYDTLSGDNGNNLIVATWSPSDYTINTLSFSPSTVSIAANVLTGSTVSSNTLSITGNTTATKLKAIVVSGSNTHFDLTSNALDLSLSYKKGAGAVQSYSLTNDLNSAPLFPPTSLSNGNSVTLTATSVDWFLGSATYGIQLYNGLDGNTVCSNIWTVGLNVPANTTATIKGNQAFSSVNGLTMVMGTCAGLTSIYGYTYYASILSQNMINSGLLGLININTTGNNVPISITAKTTNVFGTPLNAIFGNTYVSDNTLPTSVNLVAGLTVGPTKDSNGNTNSCGLFWVGLGSTGSVGTTGSGVIWLYNNTAGATIANTGLTYSYVFARTIVALGATSGATPVAQKYDNLSSQTLAGIAANNTDYYAVSSSSSATTDPSQACMFTFLETPSPITVSMSVQNVAGSVYSTIKYIKNGGALTTYSTPISISQGDTLKIVLRSPASITPGVDSGKVILRETTTPIDIITIPYTA
jgi:hypothetical protein